jgi:hypothetical protein
VRVSWRGGAGRARRGPAVGAGIVSPPGVETDNPAALTAPHDHFGASPNGGVSPSGDRRIGRAGGCPRVRNRIVSAARVQGRAVVKSTPDDHFAAGPDCRVIQPRSGGVDEACWIPCVIDADNRRTGYGGKRVIAA